MKKSEEILKKSGVPLGKGGGDNGAGGLNTSGQLIPPSAGWQSTPFTKGRLNARSMERGAWSVEHPGSISFVPVKQGAEIFNWDGSHLNRGAEIFNKDGSHLNRGAEIFNKDGSHLNRGAEILNKDGSHLNQGAEIFNWDGSHLNRGAEILNKDGSTRNPQRATQIENTVFQTIGSSNTFPLSEGKYPGFMSGERGVEGQPMSDSYRLLRQGEGPVIHRAQAETGPACCPLYLP